MWWPALEDIATAVLVVIVTVAGMRVIYGYWPWQQYPKASIRRDVETVFREQPPPFQPISEADMVAKPEAKIETADEEKPKD